jgi:hypothetical protein
MRIDNITGGRHANVGTNFALDVNVQDQTTRSLDLRFIQALAPPTTLSVAAVVEDTSITVTSTVGFIDTITVGIFTPDGNFYFGQQIGAVAGNVVSLDTPIDVAYPIGSTVLPASHHLNIDGSVTTQIFQVGPVGGETNIDIDITRIMGYIQTGSVMDDSLFGNIAALTYGVVLRQNNGTMVNIWNVKSNGEIGLLAFDANDTDKAPAGSFGFRFRNTYAGASKHGVTLRMEPGDILEILIQDDLTDLEDFQIMAQGHVVFN